MVLSFLFCLQKRYYEYIYSVLFWFYLTWFDMQYPSSLTHNLDKDI